MKTKEPQIIYYDDVLNDEFSTAQITPKKIDENYVYVHKGPWKAFTHFFWLRIVAQPIATVYLKLKFHHKIVNKEVIKPYKKKSFFMYGNHTHFMNDALIPAFIVMPKDFHVIVHANNVSMPFLGRITPSLGALPLPDDKKATRNFTNAIETRVKQGRPIIIYPEAHIWPYCTWIRPFTSLSFRYPIEYDTPVFCFTNVYKKRKHSNTPTVITYVDGPFFHDKEASRKDAREKLRNQVYEAMCSRAKESDIELVKYIKREEAND